MCFPEGAMAPLSGPLLAATPSGSVLVLGSSAPPELLPESPGVPFLLELSTSGEAVRSFAFVDAPGPEVMTVAEDGSVFVAGQAGPGTLGEEAIPSVESGYYLAKLSPAFEVMAVAAIERPSVQVNALHVDAEGDLIVGTAEADFEAGSMKPAVTKFSGETLEEDWTDLFEHEIMPALIYGMTTVPDGRIVVAGLYSRTLTVGSFVLEKAVEGQDDDFAYAGWVAWLAPDDGEPLLAETFGGAVSDSVGDLELTSAGTVRLLTLHSGGSLSLFGTTVDLGDSPAAVVDMNPSGALEQAVPFGEPGKAIVELALGHEGQTYVAGGYGNPVEDVTTRGAELRRIEADGTVGPVQSFSTGYAVSELVVDAAGGVWISGGWETPFEWNAQTHEPTSPIPDEPCRFVLRTASF